MAQIIQCRLCSSDMIRKTGEFDPPWELMTCMNCNVYFIFPYYRFSARIDDSLNEDAWNYNTDISKIFDSQKEILKKKYFREIAWSRAPRGGNALEVGCGYGLLLYALQEMGYTVSGLEVVSSLKKFIDSRLNMDLKIGDFLDTDYPDNVFDLIRMKHVLEHLSDPGSVLDKIFRILKPGGVFLADVPNADSLTARISFSRKHFTNVLTPGIHLFGFTPKSIRTGCKSHGFTDLQLRTFANTSTIYNPFRPTPVKPKEILSHLLDMTGNLFSMGSVLQFSMRKPL